MLHQSPCPAPWVGFRLGAPLPFSRAAGKGKLWAVRIPRLPFRRLPRPGLCRAGPVQVRPRTAPRAAQPPSSPGLPAGLGLWAAPDRGTARRGKMLCFFFPLWLPRKRLRGADPHPSFLFQCPAWQWTGWASATPRWWPREGSWAMPKQVSDERWLCLPLSSSPPSPKTRCALGSSLPKPPYLEVGPCVNFISLCHVLISCCWGAVGCELSWCFGLIKL